MYKKIYFSILLLLLLVSCTPSAVETEEIEATETIAVQATLPQPQVNVTQVPDSQFTAEAFLDAWVEENYAAMYDMLSSISKDAITAENFEKRYRDVAASLTLDHLEYQVLTALTSPDSAQISLAIDFYTNMLSIIEREIVLNLAIENGEWKIQWDSANIMPELANDNTLTSDFVIPERGNIYDVNGTALAADADVVALGVIPGEILPVQEATLIVNLSLLTGLSTDEVYALYEYAGDDWYVPIGTTTRQEIDDRYYTLSNLGGLVMTDYSSRYYFEGVAPHAIGYVQQIFEDDLEDYLRLGYRQDQLVGASGIERWGEEYLAGQRGITVYVSDAQGNIQSRVSQVDSKPSYDLTTTFDSDFQYDVQRSLEGFTGAIVVLERDTGRILAIASSPSFDQNAFSPSNPNRDNFIEEVFTSADRPLYNRASQGLYPLGSVFKIITMAAALESGLYTPETIYDCQHTFTELPGLTFYDWTYDYHGETISPSGEVTLVEGLMRSCNPYFYHIGLDLYRQGFPDLIPELAEGFGLGKATGIGQIAEDEGYVPFPNAEGDAVQLSIGQGELLVTPLQVAPFIAALGNGGILYQPQLIERIDSPSGEVFYEFEPIINGTLPVSEETLAAIQEGMEQVVENNRGTAHRELANLDIKIYGKTGTATNPQEEPHAWFAGYTDENRTDRPDIAIVVIAENAGQGSDIGAPIFRRIVELYFFDKPLRLYPWESAFYQTEEPTPDETEAAN